MNAKQYAINTKNANTEEIKKIDDQMEKKGFLYNVGSILSGVVGAFCLFGNPWFAIPMLGLCGSMVMGKKNIMKAFDTTKKRFQKENKHIDTVLQKGLDITAPKQTARKSLLQRLKPKKKQQEIEYGSAQSKKYFANALVAGCAAASWFFGFPWLSLVSLATVGVKYLADKNFSKKQEELEDTAYQMNEAIHDYNMSTYANAARSRAMGSTNQNTQTSGRSRQNVRRPQRVPQPVQPQRRPQNGTSGSTSYRPEDVAAVEQYLRSMSQQNGQDQNVKGFQKRKI